MSEQAFKEAKSDLAFSQQLRDKQNMAQQSRQMAPAVETEQVVDEMPEDVVVEQVESEPVEDPKEKTGIIDAVKDVVQPMFDKIADMLKKKEEPKEVEVKIAGEMSPKEETPV